jgi:hypothetical protein
MFVIQANIFDFSQHKTTNFGVFSSMEKAKEAVEILVERYRKTEEEDDDDLEWMVEDYRSKFKIVSLPGVDSLDFFQNGKIPYF